MADRFTVFVRDDKTCQEQTPIVRLVLYALASRVDAKGYCWPSVEMLMKDTGLSRASVFRSLSSVRKILTVDAPGYKNSNSYIFPYQKILGDGVDKSVDKSSSSGGPVSHRDPDSLTQRPRGSHTETSGGLTQRPEEYNEDKQEVSLSLSLSTPCQQSPSETAMLISSYDGSRKPRTREEIERIKGWCRYAGLDADHTTEFIRINRLAHWCQVSDACMVQDLIADFVFKWKSDDPEGYFNYRKELRDKGIKVAS